jgi:hypothetical protein
MVNGSGVVKSAAVATSSFATTESNGGEAGDTCKLLCPLTARGGANAVKTSFGGSAIGGIVNVEVAKRVGASLIAGKEADNVGFPGTTTTGVHTGSLVIVVGASRAPVASLTSACNKAITRIARFMIMPLHRTTLRRHRCVSNRIGQELVNRFTA